MTSFHLMLNFENLSQFGAIKLATLKLKGMHYLAIQAQNTSRAPLQGFWDLSELLQVFNKWPGKDLVVSCLVLLAALT